MKVMTLDERQRYSLHEKLIRYGTILKDTEFEDRGVFHRIRIIISSNSLYYDRMCNGEVIECHKLEW